MHRNRHLFVVKVFSIESEKQCLKMQIFIERIGENAILMHFHSIVHLQNWRTFYPQIIDDFSSGCGNVCVSIGLVK